MVLHEMSKTIGAILKMTTETNELPYGADLKVIFTIVEVVSREGNISVSELYKHLPIKSNPTKSYSKKTAEFLGLITSKGYAVEITEIGKLFVANKGEENRKKFLANNMPKKYKMLLGWIDSSKEGIMELSELKQAIIRSKLEDKKNPDIYDWMLNSFANFGESIGILKYIKGQKSRCEITEFGKQVLSVNERAEAPLINIQNKEQNIKPKQIFYADIELEGEYPIRILTKEGKPFDWDIHSEEDWKVVEAALEAIKRRWKDKNEK